jgi:hypothetical protein
MVTPNLPMGEDRVALGAKAKQDEGFAMHKAGTHTESEYADLGKGPSQKKALKPHIGRSPQGGPDA